MDGQELHISTAQYALTVLGDHTARDGAEVGRKENDRKRAINGDGQKKVTTKREEESENVSDTEGEKTKG